MSRTDFQAFEGYTILPHGIIHETYFITRRGILGHRRAPFRRDLYKMADGSVVAMRDSGVNVDTTLYMDETFVDFYRYEPELETILADQGITDFDLVKTFRME